MFIGHILNLFNHLGPLVTIHHNIFEWLAFKSNLMLTIHAIYCHIVQNRFWEKKNIVKAAMKCVRDNTFFFFHKI